MVIYLDKRAVRQIRLSAQDEEGDMKTLREDILEAFSEEQVEDIERLLDNGDFFKFLGDILYEWGGDVDELFEILETSLGELNIDLKYNLPSNDDDDDEDETDPDDDDFDADPDDDDDDDDVDD